VPKKFVLLKLDFPRKREMSDELKKQNAEWRDRIGVRGYPSIILADAKGKAYAKTGYQRGGAEAYVKHLDELRQKRGEREKALAEAEKLQGVEKAKALDAALDAVDPGSRAKDYAHVIEEIIKLDADGKAGLKAKYEAVALKGKIDAAMSAGKMDEAIKIADEALVKTGNKGDAAQELLWSKSYACFKKKDKENAQKFLEAALEAAPDGKMAPQIKSTLKRVFKIEK